MKNENLPAFPYPNSDLVDAPRYGGLTKREYFAAMAMQGILANSEFLRSNKDVCVEKTAIIFADDLLSALSTTTDKID